MTRAGLLTEVARHPPESAFDEVGDTRSRLGPIGSQAQLSEIANQRSVPIVEIRGTARPLRDWIQERGRDGALRNWGLAPDAANPIFAWFRNDLDV